MKKFMFIWRYKFTILMLLFVFFLLGYFITEYMYNATQARYTYVFTSEQRVDELLEESFYTEVFEKIDAHNLEAETDSTLKKISYAKIDYSSMLKKAKYSTNDHYHEFSIQKKYFPSIVSSTTGKVNQSENRIKNYFNLVLGYTEYPTEFERVYLSNNQNPWLIGGISSGCCALVLVILCGFVIAFYKQEEIPIENNATIFTSIFHKAYWKNTLTFMHDVKKLCTISVLFGLMMICKFIPIPSGFGSLGIGFTYLFFATICLIYGPICGLFIGFCSDIIGYFIQPGGMFFLGYTLDAMLAGFTYGICFYKKRITLMNCITARVVVNLFVNVGLGSIWWKTIYNLNWEAYQTYVLLNSLPKNVLYLLPQSILLYLLFKAIAKHLSSFGLIDERISENVKLF